MVFLRACRKPFRFSAVALGLVPTAVLLSLGVIAGCDHSISRDSDHVTVVSGGDARDDAKPRPDSTAPSTITRPRLPLEAGAEDPAATRPRLPVRPIRPGVVNDITFDDLKLEMAVDTLFDPQLVTDRIRQLDRQKVRIRGFIFAGGVFQQTGITSFPLVMNTQCKFGPGGFAYCVILVDLDDGVTADFTTRPVSVEGTLSIRPYNSGGFTWSVYHLQGHKVR